ncbi:TPA: hypothetical protein EYO57_13975 [Candidatus Poribacteria bacterium]|nr:hypothetical protein [Candidatus Poribacteria bacterium]
MSGRKRADDRFLRGGSFLKLWSLSGEQEYRDVTAANEEFGTCIGAAIDLDGRHFHFPGSCRRGNSRRESRECTRSTPGQDDRWNRRQGRP